MPRKYLNFIVLVIILFSLSGCGSFVTLSDNKQWPNQIYAGTRASANGHSTQIDVPFSLVMDTILLPYTVSRTIYNFTHIDTLFYEVNAKRLKSEILIYKDQSVLVFYSSQNIESQTVWPKLVELTNKKRKQHWWYMVFSLDKNKKDAATLVSKHTFPKFLLKWVEPWEEGQLKLTLQSAGINIEEPLALPFIVVRDSKGIIVKQWNGIQDLFEVEDVLNSLDERGWR